MGIHTIGKLLPNAIENAGFDVKSLGITGSSTRKNLLTKGIGSGVPGAFMSGIAGHKSLSSLKSYTSPREHEQQAINNIISSEVTGGFGGSYSNVLEKVTAKDVSVSRKM